MAQIFAGILNRKKKTRFSLLNPRSPQRESPKLGIKTKGKLEKKRVYLSGGKGNGGMVYRTADGNSPSGLGYMTQPG